jgi:enterochelin esterase-like enzyme
MPCGDGGFFPDSPGNLYGDVQRLTLGPGTGVVDLSLTHRIRPSEPVPPGGTCQQGNPSDSAHVKHVKIKSDLLSSYWGRPMYIGANVLLPQGYDPHGSSRYPVLYEQTHFPFNNPFGFDEGLGNSFSRWWVSFAAPRMIVVEIRHENPFFDDSYAVNSANLGPYGDAITSELMPYIDTHFRSVRARWGRALSGGSTGGWEALAQQVFYPDLYAGVWSMCPDPVDFRFHQLVNVYDDPNAYVTRHEFLDVPRPSARETTGETLWTMEEENHWEAALGSRGRSQLGQWDIWQAVYGPQGPDGYPAPIWNKLTGEIDHAVAGEWKPMDIRIQLERHWATLGPKLTGRIHVFVGDADTFFLNNAVHLLQGSLDSVSHPAADAEFRYGVNQPHCWSPFSAQRLVTVIAHALQQGAPPGADTFWIGEAARAPVAPGRGSTSPDARQTGRWGAVTP